MDQPPPFMTSNIRNLTPGSNIRINFYPGRPPRLPVNFSVPPPPLFNTPPPPLPRPNQRPYSNAPFINNRPNNFEQIVRTKPPNIQNYHASPNNNLSGNAPVPQTASYGVPNKNYCNNFSYSNQCYNPLNWNQNSTPQACPPNIHPIMNREVSFNSSSAPSTQKWNFNQNNNNHNTINITLNNYIGQSTSHVDVVSQPPGLVKSEYTYQSNNLVSYPSNYYSNMKIDFPPTHSTTPQYNNDMYNVPPKQVETKAHDFNNYRRSRSPSPSYSESFRERRYRSSPRRSAERTTSYRRSRSSSCDRNRRKYRSPSPRSKSTRRSRRSPFDSSRSKRYSSERKYRSYDRSYSPERYRDRSTSDRSYYKKSTVATKTSRGPSRSPEYSLDLNEDDQIERKKLVEKWRKSVETKSNVFEAVWIRSAPAELYYKRQAGNPEIIEASEKLRALCDEFETSLVKRAEEIRNQLPKYVPPPRKRRLKVAKHKSIPCNSSSSSDSESEKEDFAIAELERKKLHPYRLHPELWFNDQGEVNDGPLCRCSAKAKRSGIRHNIYAGELSLKQCDIYTNNANTLYHYKITISPPTNFLVRTPTIINYDEHEFIFEGFSMFSHGPIGKLPVCKVIRFNIEYTILYEEEKLPDNFTIKELDLFYDFLFYEILELVDLDFKAAGDPTGCSQFHFMPRFVRELADNGKEILPMNEVLRYLLKSSEPLIDEHKLEQIITLPQSQWQLYTEAVKGMVVTYPGKKPCALRVDQLDRDPGENVGPHYPEIVHFGIRPPQLSYAGNPEYQKSWREYVKLRHLLANMPKPSYADKRKLVEKENKLQDMRTQNKMKRDVTVTVDSKNFVRTGIMCDIVQHAMLIPVLVTHLRFHKSLDILEEKIDYKFKNRYLLQLALTHPSYRENFGTNPDHARNSLTNCGIRQPKYGDRRIHYMNTRKRGINTLINIMSRFGKKTETESNITHNERLEFLGDAVVEFVTSIHLFHIFPDLEEGGLATYRAAIVQNQHLALLAKKLNLEEFMLYAHGSDLCHDLELRHAMANCFEALMGALFLDGGISVADKVFGETLFKTEPVLLKVWVNYPPHPLQEQEPLGDRKWIPSFALLQKLVKFEESIGVTFTHIRLLARAFTDRSIGYTNLTLGSNQRLEFLGDTVLQLIASEYLYKYFPEHHEGHLSLLRSSLVNNRTQSVVCNDLGMAEYALYSNPKAELKTKDRADLLEAFLGALYVDKGIEHCQTFCSVCFFPRLQDFILHQDWNDPKSKLQQCCLTLRTMEGGEPEIPVYKVIECMGPTNTRIYTVAVYFKGKRLAKASGHSIQQAEMNAAKNALEISQGLFPQLDHQKRVISKSMKRQNKIAPVYRGRSYSRLEMLKHHNRFRSRSRSPSYDRRSRYSLSREQKRSPSSLRRSYSKARHSSRSISRDRKRSPSVKSNSRRSYSRAARSSRSRSTSSSGSYKSLRKKKKTYRSSSDSSDGRRSNVSIGCAKKVDSEKNSDQYS